LNVPIYPKECSNCSEIICDTCLFKYEKTKPRNSPACVHCKSENNQSFTDVKSKILRGVIDKIKVGHRCNRFKDLEIFTVQDLRRHVESGDCGGYYYKCFCDS
jgi:hypothetical protein